MRRALLLLIVAIVGLAACESPPPARYPEITYRSQPPIELDVATVEVVQAYQPPLQSPNVEHLFPVSVPGTVARWADDRLRAVGGSGTARFIVQDASVKEVPLPTKKGITGMLTTDQEARLEGRMKARLEIVQAGGLAKGFAEAEASRTQTVPEGIALAARERIFFQMEEAMAKDLDRAMAASIREHLGPFVR